MRWTLLRRALSAAARPASTGFTAQHRGAFLHSAKTSLDFLAKAYTPAHAARLAALDNELRAEQSWEQAADKTRAPLRREQARLAHRASTLDRLRGALADVEELLAICDAEKDADLEQACVGDLQQLANDARQAELAAMLSGPADSMSCFVEISAGQGGTEAMDWVRMLAEMYEAWAESMGFAARQTDVSHGPEAGFRQVVFRVTGENAYGYLRSEAGTHRLIRNSPFDKSARRHTSFAQVGVFPSAAHGGGGDDDDADGIEVKDSDVKVEAFRSSGPGGQGVNTTSSAIRVTHLPTGLVVQSQNERSQLQNRLTALSVLKARLLEKRLKERNESLWAARGALGEATFGTQIRTVVLNPQHMVKDHRTGREVADAAGYLSGATTVDFMEDYLRVQSLKGG